MKRMQAPLPQRCSTPDRRRGPRGDTAGSSSEILLVTARLAAELRPQREITEIGLGSSLDRDLGFDSLARFELVSRIERAFQVTLPESLAADAETPRDLLRAVLAAPGGRQRL